MDGRGLLDLETGVVVSVLEDGDRIVRASSASSYHKLKDNARSFIKVDHKEVSFLLKILDRNEMAVLFAMQSFVSYESCLLRFPNGKDIHFDNIVDLVHMSRTTVNDTLKSLIDKNLIYKGRNGRNFQYFMNPWICFKGSNVNPTLKDMFKNYNILSKGGIRWGDLND